MPVLLPQSSQLENREWLGRFERGTQQVGHLLGDGASIPIGSRLQFQLERIRKINDVQRGHGLSSTITPLCLHNRWSVKRCRRDVKNLRDDVSRRCHFSKSI